MGGALCGAPAPAALEFPAELAEGPASPQASHRTSLPVYRIRLIARLLPVYALGAVAGYAVTATGMPLGWMIGGMIASGALTLALNMPAPPRRMSLLGQIVVGGAVGLFLTPAAMLRIVENALPIMLVAVLTVIAGFLIALAERRWFRNHKATALFGSIPGGPMEMASLAHRYGGAADQVALAQMLRIGLIVVLFPLLVLASGAEVRPMAVSVQEAGLPGLAVILGLGWAAGWVLWRIGITNPYFLGPMAVMGGLTAAGAGLPEIPAPAIWAAQVLLGVGLGAMFRRETLRGGRSVAMQVVSGTLVLLVVCCGIALMLVALFDLDPATMLLASAPGGVTEMTLTAKAVDADVSLVAAFHIARVFLILPLIPLIYRAFLRIG